MPLHFKVKMRRTLAAVSILPARRAPPPHRAAPPARAPDRTTRGAWWRRSPPDGPDPRTVTGREPLSELSLAPADSEPGLCSRRQAPAAAVRVETVTLSVCARGDS